MDGKLLATSPCVEHEDIRGHVTHLPNDIELAKSIEPCTGFYDVVEFRTAAGEALAISIPRSECAVIRHLQERMPYYVDFQ